MAKQYHVFKKKKNKIPSKKVLNLYYKEDKTTRSSTIALYVLFVLVLIPAIGKIAVYDKVVQLREAKAVLAENQTHLEQQMAYLADYNDVSSQYSRYSYSYLKSEEKVSDRMDIMDMLEETVIADSQVESIVITENVVSVIFNGLDLQESAWMAKKIEAFEIVESVSVNTSSLNAYKNGEEENLVTQMVISMVSDESEEAGGKQ